MLRPSWWRIVCICCMNCGGLTWSAHGDLQAAPTVTQILVSCASAETITLGFRMAAAKCRCAGLSRHALAAQATQGALERNSPELRVSSSTHVGGQQWNGTPNDRVECPGASIVTGQQVWPVAHFSVCPQVLPGTGVRQCFASGPAIASRTLRNQRGGTPKRA